MAAGITSGARLIAALVASGTGEAKVAPARRHLEAAGADRPAAEIYSVLQQHGAPPGTLAKAVNLLERGVAEEKAPEKPIEQRLLEAAGEAVPTAEAEKPAEPAKPEPVAAKPAAKSAK